MGSKSETKFNKPFLILSGALGVLLLLGAYNAVVWLSTKQTKISCHTPTLVATQTEYCVYHARSGLLVDTNTLLIGPSPGRGIVYTVPYTAQDIQVEWSTANDAAIIRMPGTELTIAPGVYIDTR